MRRWKKMSKVITKQSLRRYLDIMKETENEIMFFYEDIAKNVDNKKIKKAMNKLAKEEEKHTVLVKKLSTIIG